MSTKVIRIVGIDPGLRRSGWGIIESDGVRLSYIASGFIASSSDEELAYRLREIYEGLAGVLASFKPDEAAVEETFVNKDARATLKLGQARGAIMVVGAQHGLRIEEYAPARVKKAVVGHGRATKAEIQARVRLLCHLKRPPNADAADALALAICHGHAAALLASLPPAGKHSGAKRRRSR